jgi:hypothetical protein
MILSVLLSLVTKGSLYWNAEIWLSDYPPDIQEKYGAMSAKAKKPKAIVSAFFLAALFGPIVASLLRLNQQIAGASIFWPAFLTTFVMLQVFNIVDLLILDWLIFVTWQPRFLILPGTEGMAGYKDYGFHFKGFVAGTVLWLILSFIVAGLSLLLSPMPREAVDFLRDHQQVIDLDAEHPDFYLLDKAAQEARVIFLGESHGIATNDDVNFALFTYLHETAGVRTYIAETGYSMGHFLNEYVQTGDIDLLRKIYRMLEGTTAWNQAQFAFWQRVYAWNQTLPEAERVRVVGLDVEHQYPIGVWYLATLLPESPPENFAEPVTVSRAMFEDGQWDTSACKSAVNALLDAMAAHPDAAMTYLGANFDKVHLVLRSLQAGFVFYTTENNHTADVARYHYMAETYFALGLQDETVYGKWGAEHVYQAQYRGIEHIAKLLDDEQSPVAGRVLSIASVYVDSTQLYKDDGDYAIGAYDAPVRIGGPLRQAAAGDITLFQLTGSTSPFAQGLYLMAYPTAGGVTTDYVQFVILMQGAEAAKPLGE